MVLLFARSQIVAFLPTGRSFSLDKGLLMGASSSAEGGLL